MEPAAVDESKYWGFVSYSSNDQRIALWLQRSLEKYKFPKKIIREFPALPSSLSPICLDRNDLSARSNLPDEILEKLRASRFLIVICSTSSAKSDWVTYEINEFRCHSDSSKILAIVVEGNPASGEGSDRCIPAALLTGDESTPWRMRVPLAVDLRKGGDGTRNAVLKIAAAMTGITLTKLQERDSQRRKQYAVIVSALSGAIIIGAIVATLAVFFFTGRSINPENLHAQLLERVEQQLEKDRSFVPEFVIREAMIADQRPSFFFVGYSEPRSIPGDFSFAQNGREIFIFDPKVLSFTDRVASRVSGYSLTGSLRLRIPEYGVDNEFFQFRSNEILDLDGNGRKSVIFDVGFQWADRFARSFIGFSHNGNRWSPISPPFLSRDVEGFESFSLAEEVYDGFQGYSESEEFPAWAFASFYRFGQFGLGGSTRLLIGVSILEGQGGIVPKRMGFMLYRHEDGKFIPDILWNRGQLLMSLEPINTINDGMIKYVVSYGYGKHPEHTGLYTFDGSLFGNDRKEGGGVLNFSLSPPLPDLAGGEEPFPLGQPDEVISLRGTWISVDDNVRFELRCINDEEWELIEKNVAGKQFSFIAQPSTQFGEKVQWVIERNNQDPALLSFFGIRPDAQKRIVESQPDNSVMIVSREGKRLKAEWFDFEIFEEPLGTFNLRLHDFSCQHYEFKLKGGE